MTIKTKLLWGDETELEFLTSKLEIETEHGRVLVRGEGGNREERRVSMLALLDYAREIVKGSPS